MSVEPPKAKLREISRIIVSAVILSKDKKVLMGRKDPSRGGVYPDCWHIPGGGVDEGETLEQALEREIAEETGIDVAPYKPKLLPYKDTGVSEKTLKDTGEKVICNMEFNRFKVEIDKNADEIKLKLSDDLIETRWFTMEELPGVKQVPGGREFFQKIGLIPKD